MFQLTECFKYFAGSKLYVLNSNKFFNANITSFQEIICVKTCIDPAGHFGHYLETNILRHKPGFYRAPRFELNNESINQLIN